MDVEVEIREEWGVDCEVKDDSDSECECLSKCCCINFNRDLVHGNKKTITIAVLKAVCFVIVVSLLWSGFGKLAQQQKKELMRSFLITTKPPKVKYAADFKELIGKPVPEWYDQAKIGVHIQWGPRSVTGFDPPEFLYSSPINYVESMMDFIGETSTKLKYTDTANMFTAELFEPDFWAQLFVASGAKYVVVTSKSFDGYCLFPSDQSTGWNSVDIGPHRDLVGDIANAISNVGLRLGLKYAVFEEKNTLYEKDKESRFQTSFYSKQKLWPDLIKLVNTYRPSLLYFSELDFIDRKFNWRPLDFLAWLYSYSAVSEEVIALKNRDLVVLSYATLDRKSGFLNKEILNDGIDIKMKMERIINIDRRSLEYRRKPYLEEFDTTKRILYKIVKYVSKGFNAILSVAPTKDGTIPAITQKRLFEVGKWLKRYEEAIYDTVPWYHHQEYLNTHVFYTCKYIRKEYEYPFRGVTYENGTKAMREKYEMSAVYAIYFTWPENNILRLRTVAFMFKEDKYQIESLDYKAQFLNWRIFKNGIYTEIEIDLPRPIVMARNKHGWVLKITKADGAGS